MEACAGSRPSPVTPTPLALSPTWQVAHGGRWGWCGAFTGGGAAGCEAQRCLSDTAQQNQSSQGWPQGRLRRETKWSLREEEGILVGWGRREPGKGEGSRDQRGWLLVGWESAGRA